jgi:hypothetical protein
MIVPDYWTEARRQDRKGNKRYTVRRYGWSTISMEDAAVMAEARADDALRRLLSGEKLDRRERKVAYNGAEGVPIREEVLERHGAEVISRNAYGAHCLNSPRLLFADIDFEVTISAREYCFSVLNLLGVSIGVGALLGSFKWALILALASFPLGYILMQLFKRVGTLLGGGPAMVARKRLAAFLASRPDWNVRLYATPAGLRLMATHREFAASEPDVDAFFRAVGADPLYVRMCKNQQCFRARLTAKPWRVGVPDHMRPRPGVWPVSSDKQALRDAWVARYEARAREYASCRFLTSMGSGKVAFGLSAVVELHDNACRALQQDCKLA